MEDIYYQEPITPQLSELETKSSGNPMLMMGLMRAIDSIYTVGMSLDEVQVAIGAVIHQQLTNTLQTMDQVSAQVALDFLGKVDYALGIDYDKQVRNNK